MLLRMVVSASVAIAILLTVITLGMRTLDHGPIPEGTFADPPPAPVGIPLYRSDDAGPRFSQRDVEALREYLAMSPAARLEQALAREDVRFLGVNGFTLRVPSVDDAPRALREGRVLPIPGTTEAVISEEHGELVERAASYAGAYNALLLRRVSEPVGR